MDRHATFVRLALPRDVAAVAAVQARAWRESYADLLPAVVLARLEPNARDEWSVAVERPPTSAHHLLVAVADGEVSGFAATAPADPDDGGPGTGALTVLAVDPPYRGAGHGSRLLQAVADTLCADGFASAVCWLPERDEVQQGFLASAGWAPDGARRELDTGTGTLAEVRLHTALGQRP